MFVRVETPIFSTEDVQKVINALLNIFPELIIEIDEKNNKIVGTTDNLNKFKELLSEQKIRDTARTILRRDMTGNRVEFRLNKQVATVGKINFAERSPLGDIIVSIESNDIKKLIDDLTRVI
jgi:hypothetical protein